MSDTARDQAIAQCESIVAMVGALDVDYDRLQELKEKAEAGHYVAGYNMPGYMPDSDPATFDDAEDAREYLAACMRDDAATFDPREFPEDGKTAADLETVADNLESSDCDEYGETIGRYHYFITHIPGKLACTEEQEELDALSAAAGNCESEEDAQERIQQDPLSVEVRSDWVTPGEDMTAGEFRIVLCTGGPHVELVGDLDDYKEPSRVRVLYKDWGESGELFDFDRDTVLTYCRQFYFGE